MIIENKENGRFILTPETETLEDIGIAVIMASYELAKVFGLGALRPFETKMTKEMARKMITGEDISHNYAVNLNKKNDVYMDYVFGRCCKTHIKTLPKVVEVYISPRDRNPRSVIAKAQELLRKEK